MPQECGITISINDKIFGKLKDPERLEPLRKTEKGRREY